MASNTVTYGKQRGLLRSLGSRRRQKQSADPFASKTHEPQTISMNAYHDPTNLPYRVRDHRPSNSIEELASALLDDSTMDLSKGDIPQDPALSAPTPQNELKTSESYLDLRDEHHLPLPPRASQTKLDLATAYVQVDLPQTGKHAPRSAKGILTRSATTREQSDSLQKRRELGLGRPLSQVPGSRDRTGLQPSFSVPLSPIVGVGSPAMMARETVANPEPNPADQIGQKVRDMLAATGALKSTAAQPAAPSSRISRITPSKVLSKMTGAWDRFYKHSTSDQKVKKTDTPPVLDEIDPVTFSDIAFEASSPTVAYSISTIEIRLNEGDNLNKRKVQKIVGGQVARKPVAEDGKSLRGGKSIDDPFSEPGTLISLESRLTLATNENTQPVPPLPCNPFETEKSFDSNLEDRILSSSPLGSSTPRIRVQRISASTSSGSPNRRRSRSILGHAVLETLTFPSTRPQMVKTREPTGFVSQTDALAAARPTRGFPRRDAGRGIKLDFTEGRRVKKHPSPSKGALEDLEVAFKQFEQLRNSGADPDELDELAQTFVPSTPLLAPRDQNQMLRSRQSNGMTYSPHSRVFGIRIPLPTELRREIRLAPPYRPGVANADDDDELM